MKILLKLLLLIIVLAVLALVFFTGPVIKATFNKSGSIVLGVPMKVGDVDVRLFRGLIQVKDLVLGNPEGFKTDELFKMTSLNVDIKMSSLFTDTIIVRKLEIVGPEITYEKTLTSSNVEALNEKLSGGKKDSEPKEEEAAAEEKSGKKVIVEKFILNEGQVNLSLPGMMGTALPIPLPPLEMTDIGKEDEGASITDVIAKIYTTIFSSVINVVTSSGKLLGDGAKLIGSGAAAVGGATVDGVGAVGGAAVDAGKAVGKGVAGAVGGVVNLFGGGSDEKEKSADEAPAATEETQTAE